MVVGGGVKTSVVLSGCRGHRGIRRGKLNPDMKWQSSLNHNICFLSQRHFQAIVL